MPKTGGIAPAEEVDGRDSYAVTAVADIIDRSLHATIARFTLGLSPAALSKAYFDWAIASRRVAGQTAATRRQGDAQIDPFRQLRVPLRVAGRQDIVLHRAAAADRRFDGADWQKSPYNFMAQAFLLQQQWWHNATTGIRGVTKHHEEMVEFVSRQMLDMVSPSNFLLTNPEVLRQTISKAA